MNIYNFENYEETKFSSPSLIILGKFETFHKGHQELINQAKNFALKNKLELILLLYEIKVSNDNKPVFSNEDRILIAKKLGINNLLFFQPSKDNYQLSIPEFAKILKENYNANQIFVGSDFTFNKSFDDLEILDSLIATEVVPIFKLENHKVSSSIISSFIQASEIKQANDFLGFNYFYSGRVIPGNQNGTNLIGIPTANVKNKDTLIPGIGVYYSYLVMDNKKYPSVTSVYNNDTILKTDEIFLETYILNFDNNIYGKNVRVELLDLIRFPKKYANINALKEAILNDINLTIIYFKK